MCGIFGYAGLNKNEFLLQRMAEKMMHRGPDDNGFLIGDRIGMGMVRLSIIDIAGGHQPIFNKKKTKAIFFNGEIYNYKDLTEDLKKKGYPFRTSCDTETILHLYEEYGANCVNHLRGIFSFAIYDIPNQKLFLARDRLGVKPLYFWQKDGRLVFASEIKSILEYDEVPREPNLSSIDSYLTFRYSPGPQTMFKEIKKFPAAHWALWEKGQLKFENYWKPPVHSGPYEPDSYYHERFAELFQESVSMRLMSEAPIGAFLSGGVDSTAIVATMARLSSKPVNTFSVGFNWPGDETSTARETAEELGCKHHEIICKPEDLGTLPEIIWSLDEPIGDAIAVPIHLLSKFAHQHVKVVLTGEGADEVLAGYLFHKVLFWARQYTKVIPDLLKKQLIEPSIKFLPHWLLKFVFSYPEGLEGRGILKTHDFLRGLRSSSLDSQYELLISLFDQRDKNKYYEDSLLSYTNQKSQVEITNSNYLDSILKLQLPHWLPDLMLTKLDKLTMASSLEGRVPFLDHKLLEFLFKTPPHLKLKGLTDKWILRNYLSDQLPGKYSRAPKKPFYMPIKKFLNEKPLKDFVDFTFSKEVVKKRGYFKWDGMQKLRKNVGKDFVFDKQIFSLVSLEIWHQIFIDQKPGWVGTDSKFSKNSFNDSTTYV